jgi:hypothetical protein
VTQADFVVSSRDRHQGARFNSDIELVSQPAVNQPLHHIAVIEVVWEAQLDVTRGIETNALDDPSPPVS